MSRSGRTGGRLADVSHFFLSRVEEQNDKDPSPEPANATPAPRTREHARDAIWISSVVAGIPSAFLTANLAIATARSHTPVRIIDLESGPFTVPSALGVSPAYTALVQRYREEGRVRVSTIEGPEGIEIVSAPPDEVHSVGQGDDRTLMVNMPPDLDLTISHGTAIVLARTDPEGLLAAYEWLKGLAESSHTVSLGAAILAERAEAAKEGYDRLSTACQRFLGRPFAYFGYLPSGSLLSIHQSLSAGCPLLDLAPDSETAGAILDMAKRIRERRTSEGETLPVSDPPASEIRARPRHRVDLL